MLPSLKACLHVGGGSQIGEVTCGGSWSPHLSYTRDQIKMRYYMDRRVTSPSWGPPLTCKQALRTLTIRFPFSHIIIIFAYYTFFFIHFQLKRQTRSYISVKWTRESQSVYPLSDQNGAKTIPFWAAHTYQANIREYHPCVKTYISLLLLSNRQLNMQSAKTKTCFKFGTKTHRADSLIICCFTYSGSITVIDYTESWVSRALFKKGTCGPCWKSPTFRFWG